MARNPEWRIMLRPLASRLIAILVLALALAAPCTQSFAQAAGHVRARIVKAGLLIGGGAGSGVLTYRGKTYPFRITGMSFGITVGATVGRLDGWASGIGDVGDFAGTYSSVGGGFASHRQVGLLESLVVLDRATVQIVPDIHQLLPSG